MTSATEYDNSGRGRLEGSSSPQPHSSQHRRYKRFQACVACRATKTKCLPSEHHNSCQSCLKNSRPCVMPGPPKQRIKSAQKFSELEKKLELLTNALADRDLGVDSDASTNRVALDRPSIPDFDTRAIDSNHKMIGDREKYHQEHSEKIDGVRRAGTSTYYPPHAQLDVLDEGWLTKETAASLFTHWLNNMQHFVPVTLLPSSAEAEHFRRDSPLLFLTILTIASSSTCPSLASRLATRLTSDLGQQVFSFNNQSVDSILALLLFSQYYFKPGGSSSVAPSQYIYSAVAMVSDLGLHSKARNLLSNSTGTALEAARVCVSEWFSASTATIFLQRAPIVQHKADLDRYASIIQSEQQGSAKWLFNLIDLQKILEKASLLLDPFENKSGTAFDEPGTQYKMNALLQQLDRWEASVSDEADHRLKQHGRHVAYLQIQFLTIRCYVRKVTIQKQTNNAFTPNQNDGMMGLTPLHFDSLTKCMTSIKALFDIYLSLEISLIRCLPNSYLSWNVTAAFLLIKLGHFGESLSNLEPLPSGVSSKPTFQATVIHYLDSIVAKMDHASQGGYIPQARPFINILRKLKPYYLTKRTICINSHGDADVVDQEETADISRRGPETHNTYQNSNTRTISTQINNQASQAVRPIVQSPSSDRYSQPSSGSISGGHWTPSSSVSHFDVQPQSYQVMPEGQARDQALDINAAYDPSTYANTDWASLTLDQGQIDQLDTFMFSEEDTSWMQYLL